MKSIITLIASVLVLLTSCTNNPVTKSYEDQYMGVINDKINEHNQYWVNNGYEGDTMSFVSIDTVINIENCAVFNVGKDTSKIKIINHATATLVFVTVKMYLKGYYSKETIVFHLSSLSPKNVWMQTPNMDYETMTYEPINVNQVIGNYRKDEETALKEYKVMIQSQNEQSMN